MECKTDLDETKCSVACAPLGVSGPKSSRVSRKTSHCVAGFPRVSVVYSRCSCGTITLARHRAGTSVVLSSETPALVSTCRLPSYRGP